MVIHQPGVIAREFVPGNGTSALGSRQLGWARRLSLSAAEKLCVPSRQALC
jgi:hypothetical protein